jgi:hypothetical protein
MPEDLITSLGITNSTYIGDLKAAESFLSGEIVKEGEELEKLPLDANGKPIPPKKPASKEPIEEEKKPKEVPLKKEGFDYFEDGGGDGENKKPIVEKKEPIKGEEEEKEVNPILAVSKQLYESGVLSVAEGEDVPEIQDAETLLLKFQQEGEKKATAWLDGFLERFGDDYKDMFTAVFINGVAPADYLPIYSRMQDFNSLDMKDENAQEAVAREYYRRQDYSPEIINKKITKLKDYGDLAEESAEMHERILAQDSQELLQLEEQKKQELQRQQLADQAYATNITKALTAKTAEKEFEGIPVNEKVKKAAFDFLNTKRYKTKDGTLLTEFDKFILDTKAPENLNKRIKIAILALNDFNLSAIEKKAVTKETNSLFRDLARNTSKTKKEALGSKSPQLDPFWDNLG